MSWIVINLKYIAQGRVANKSFYGLDLIGNTSSLLSILWVFCVSVISWFYKIDKIEVVRLKQKREHNNVN